MSLYVFVIFYNLIDNINFSYFVNEADYVYVIRTVNEISFSLYKRLYYKSHDFTSTYILDGDLRF